MKLFKSIFVSLSPNLEKNDFWLAFKLIFMPWKWKKGEAGGKLEKELENYLGAQNCFLFNSGRSAFMAILKALNLPNQSEILLQGFTCNAAVNPIIWCGLRPIFVDIEKETLNMNPKDLEKKITPKTRAVLVQHTFGLPAKLDEILSICKKNNLILIEDCAHSLGAKHQGKKTGTLGNVSFFSFGRDKVISSVYGGAVAASDPELAKAICQIQNKFNFPSCFWILQQLLHPVLTKAIIMPLYAFGALGKYVLIFFQKLKILSKAVHKKEKKGGMPNYFPKKMPNALSILGLNQIRKIEKHNQHRDKVAAMYRKELENMDCFLPFECQGRVYMKYPILIDKNTDKIIDYFRKRRIFLDDGWKKAVVMPLDTDQKAMQYFLGSCPVAESVVNKIINFPTHINIKSKDAQKITKCLKLILNKKMENRE